MKLISQRREDAYLLNLIASSFSWTKKQSKEKGFSQTELVWLKPLTSSLIPPAKAGGYLEKNLFNPFNLWLQKTLCLRSR